MRLLPYIPPPPHHRQIHRILRRHDPGAMHEPLPRRPATRPVDRVQQERDVDAAPAGPDELGVLELGHVPRRRLGAPAPKPAFAVEHRGGVLGGVVRLPPDVAGVVIPPIGIGVARAGGGLDEDPLLLLEGGVLDGDDVL
ncbi:hypothetical protein PG991_015280 [Apiospora marii]|uniref:Uncharacterized protein n=1 Tax=Apiospora marii TaxID=335849 RepID=A0ABR1R150_9PEZI